MFVCGNWPRRPGRRHCRLSERGRSRYLHFRPARCCKELADASPLELPDKVASCTLALGPFAVGAAAQCLNNVVQGQNAITCLRDALGLPDRSQDDGGCPLTGGGQTCLEELPTECTGLADVDGLDLVRPNVC